MTLLQRSRLFLVCLSFVRLFNLIIPLAHRVDQKVKLMQQQVPKGFVELQEHFVGQRIENNDSLKESVHFFAWNELK